MGVNIKRSVIRSTNYESMVSLAGLPVKSSWFSIVIVVITVAA